MPFPVCVYVRSCTCTNVNVALISDERKSCIKSIVFHRFRFMFRCSLRCLFFIDFNVQYCAYLGTKTTEKTLNLRTFNVCEYATVIGTETI